MDGRRALLLPLGDVRRCGVRLTEGAGRLCGRWLMLCPDGREPALVRPKLPRFIVERDAGLARTLELFPERWLLARPRDWGACRTCFAHPWLELR